MAGSLNKVTLIGNLGADPEIRSMKDGKEVASLTLATTESWRDKNTGERKDKTEWHRVAIFNPGLVNVVKQYVKKGSKLYLEGALQTRKWQDQSGVDRYTTEVVLNGFNSSLIMLDNKGGAGAGGGFSDPRDSHFASAAVDAFPESSSSSNQNQQQFDAEELEDEIPF